MSQNLFCIHPQFPCFYYTCNPGQEKEPSKEFKCAKGLIFDEKIQRCKIEIFKSSIRVYKDRMINHSCPFNSIISPIDLLTFFYYHDRLPLICRSILYSTELNYLQVIIKSLFNGNAKLNFAKMFIEKLWL